MAAKNADQKEVWYMVSLVVFASLEAREKYFQKGSGELHTQAIFYGRTERWASVRFYRACRDAHKDPLIQGVMVHCDRELVAWASPGVPEGWSMQ